MSEHKQQQQQQSVQNINFALKADQDWPIYLTQITKTEKEDPS